MFHVNPNTGRGDHCHARSPESCPFGAELHGATKEAMEGIYSEYIANDDDPETETFFVAFKGAKPETDPIGFESLAAWDVKEVISQKKFNRTMDMVAIAAGATVVTAATGVAFALGGPEGVAALAACSGFTAGIFAPMMVAVSYIDG